MVVSDSIGHAPNRRLAGDCAGVLLFIDDTVDGAFLTARMEMMFGVLLPRTDALLSAWMTVEMSKDLGLHGGLLALFEITASAFIQPPRNQRPFERCNCWVGFG